MVNVPADKFPVTPGGKVPEVRTIAVIPPAVVYVIGVNKEFTQGDSNKEEAITVQLHASISTVVLVLYAGQVAVAAIS